MIPTSIIELFRKPSADVLAQRELDENRRSLLDAQRQLDYSQKLCEFYENRIRRLSLQVRKSAAEES